MGGLPVRSKGWLKAISRQDSEDSIRNQDVKDPHDHDEPKGGWHSVMQDAPGMEEVDAEWKRKARAYPMGYQTQSDSDERKEPNENSWSEEEAIWCAKRGGPKDID